MQRTTTDLLDLAVNRGVITADQRDALNRLATESELAPRELPRGFNWVSVAYALGALLVVFAAAWFLGERWRDLGPGGVLAVTLLYETVIVASSAWLAVRGFREAAGIAAMLAVSLVPVLVWSLESLSGWWPEPPWGRPYSADFAAESSRWVIADLATVAAGVLVLRRWKYVAVTLPVAVALLALGFHFPRSLFTEFPATLQRWTILTDALFICAVADTVDRRQKVASRDGAGRGDYAFAFWLVGLLAVSASIMAFWNTAGAWRHGLLVLSVGLMALALFLGRRTHLVFGVAGLFLYLVWLANSVFRETAFFPLSLAALGLLLIFATVWLQRRFPALSQRIGEQRGGRRGLPGPWVTPWIIAALALAATMVKTS